jgi:hypothetical protein
MYRRLPESNDAVIGYEVHGSIRQDEIKAMHRDIESAIEEHGRIRLLVDVRDMAPPGPAAIMEDLKLTPEYIANVEKFAVIGDSRWHEAVTSATNALTKGEARYFREGERAAAWTWVRD